MSENNAKYDATSFHGRSPSLGRAQSSISSSGMRRGQIKIDTNPLMDSVREVIKLLLNGRPAPKRFRSFAKGLREGILSDDCVLLDVATTEAGDLVFVARAGGVLEKLRAALLASN